MNRDEATGIETACKTTPCNPSELIERLCATPLTEAEYTAADRSAAALCVGMDIGEA